ncbi:MAG: hypothetical protein K6L73_09250 [Cellvibrionaceae bacterium]
MLQASRLKATEGQLTTIAGESAGRRVLCSNSSLSKFNELVALANKGNYWAGLVVKGIKGLTSGYLNMDNVYIQKEKNLISGEGVFYVVLPGVTATIESRQDSSFVLTDIKADANYIQMQKDKARPGLWKINKNLDQDAKLHKNCEIWREKNRPVVISDRSPDDPVDIARKMVDDLTSLDTTIDRMVKSSGFDLHHTPGDGGIVGLKPIRKAFGKQKDINESALLLANTMYRARNIEGVLWFSDWGGSAILTRALDILQSENKSSFKNHAVFLNRPTTNSTRALALAERLELSLAGKEGTRTGLRPSELRGNHINADVTWQSAGKAGLFGLSASGAYFGVVGASLGVAQIVGLGGALAGVVKIIKDGKKNFSGKKYR